MGGARRIWERETDEESDFLSRTTLRAEQIQPHKMDCRSPDGMSMGWGAHLSADCPNVEGDNNRYLESISTRGLEAPRGSCLGMGRKPTEGATVGWEEEVSKSETAEYKEKGRSPHLSPPYLPPT